jgi:hypothetical protein
MLLHFHGVEIIKCKLRNALNYDCEMATEERFSCIEIYLFVLTTCRKDIVSYGNVLVKDHLQLSGVSS